MAQVLEYSTGPRRDWVTDCLGVGAVGWVFLDAVAAIFLGNWHNGLRSYGHFWWRDFMATVGICGMPVVGMVMGLGFIWRCRRGRPVSVLLGIVVVWMHGWMLYGWGSMEVWFWRH